MLLVKSPSEIKKLFLSSQDGQEGNVIVESFVPTWRAPHQVKEASLCSPHIQQLNP